MELESAKIDDDMVVMLVAMAMSPWSCRHTAMHLEGDHGDTVLTRETNDDLQCLLPTA